MRVQQQPAFVLHAAEYRETSLLLEVFSRNYGRLGLVAKGARRAKSGLRIADSAALHFDTGKRSPLAHDEIDLAVAFSPVE